MPSAVTSGSTNRSKPKRYTCTPCSKTFDDIDILNSYKGFNHGSSEKGEKTRPQTAAGVG